MNLADIIDLRLHNQRLRGNGFKSPHEAVEFLGAVQAQDFSGSKWALGSRIPGSKEKDIDDAFIKGLILRTHMMRPTWHFVAPKDIRYILRLTSPRVHRIIRYYDVQLGLNDEIFKKSCEIIINSLKGGKQLTRNELREKLKESGIDTSSNMAVGHLVMYAELEGIIVSGARKGKQFSYALLEERVPKVKELSHDESLTELTSRYFKSHGPALVRDFSWWSGLTSADVRKGIKMLGSKVKKFDLDGKTYYHFPFDSIKKTSDTFLLSNYDEYIIGYTDHSGVFNSTYASNLDMLFTHSVIINGKVVAGWRRELKKEKVNVKIKSFRALSLKEKESIEKETDRYSKFLEIPTVLTFDN